MSRLSAKEKIRCTLFLFLIGGGLYNLIEILWRGFTIGQCSLSAACAF